MRRRQFFLFAMLVPLSLMLAQRFGLGSKYIEKDGWLLKPEDL